MKIEMKRLPTIYIIAIFTSLLFLMIYVLTEKRQPELSPLNQPVPFPTKVLLQKISPQNNFFSPFGKTTIQKTTKGEVEKLPNIISTETTSDGSTRVVVKSISAFHPDEIIISKETVVFEKNTTFTNSQGGLPQISDYLAIYNAPEKKIKGSKEYGGFTSTYLYPSKGFAFIGNEETNNIYAIMRFTPLPLSEFMSKYGTYVEQANFIEE